MVAGGVDAESIDFQYYCLGSELCSAGPMEYTGKDEWAFAIKH